jgi:hypothetical protein
MQLIDKTGLKYGRLTAVRYVGNGRWLCRCDCGVEKEFLTHNLGRHATSCGCYIREVTIARNTTHGQAHTVEYRAWCAMRRRCTDYGGRGIRVAPEWDASFERFIADVGPRPSPLHSLDRIDNNGNYEPGNVRWATRQQQSANRNYCKLLTFNGKTQNYADWSRETGIFWKTIKMRLKAGWSVEDALTKPVRRYPIDDAA